MTEIAQLRREVFALSHNLHWSYGESMGLDVAERREYVRLVSDFIAEQNETMERARRGAGG